MGVRPGFFLDASPATTVEMVCWNRLCRAERHKSGWRGCSFAATFRIGGWAALASFLSFICVLLYFSRLERLCPLLPARSEAVWFPRLAFSSSSSFVRCSPPIDSFTYITSGRFFCRTFASTSSSSVSGLTCLTALKTIADTHFIANALALFLLSSFVGLSPSSLLLVLVVSRSRSAVKAAPDRPLPVPQSLLGPRATVMAAAATATALVAAAAVVGNLAVLPLNEEGIQPIAASVGRFRHRRGLAPTPELTVETTPQPAVETPQAESAVETPPETAVETCVTPTTAVHFYHDAPADMPVIDMHWCTAPAPWFPFAPKPVEE